MRISTSMLYDNAMTEMQNRSSELLTLQTQMSTSKRVVAPSDDPIAAANALVISQAKSVNTQYTTNQGEANDALGLTENQLTGVVNLLTYVKEKAVQGANDSLNASDRKSIATDLRARFDELVAIANTTDPLGNHLFAGFQGNVKPFQGDVSSGITYVGDQGTRLVQVSSSRVMPVSNSGNDVFMNIPGMNGVFSTNATATNTGNAVIGAGSVVGVYSGHNYSLSFTSPTTFDLFDTTLGGPAILTGQPYASDTPITFSGIQVTIHGTPAAGDSFNVTPGGTTDVFSALKSLIGALEGGTAPQRNTLVQQALTKIDQTSDNVLRVQSSIGSRMNELDALKSVGSGSDIQYAATISRLTDLDYVKATTDLAQKQVALQAAQQAFAKTTNLSLFKFIS